MRLLAGPRDNVKGLIGTVDGSVSTSEKKAELVFIARCASDKHFRIMWAFFRDDIHANYTITYVT